MNFIVREKETERDMENFLALEIVSARENSPAKPGKTNEEYREELLEYLNSKSKTGIFIAEANGGKFAGFIWVSNRDGGELWDFDAQPAWIYDIRVLPKFRRQGLGTQLLLQAEQWARNEGFSKIGLHVFGSNEPAINLYQSQHYKMRNCYFQKEITLEGMVTPPTTNFRIRKKENEEDK